MNAVLGLPAVLVLTAGTGDSVAQQFSYVAADRLALAREAEAGDKRAARRSVWPRSRRCGMRGPVPG